MLTSYIRTCPIKSSASSVWLERSPNSCRHQKHSGIVSERSWVRAPGWALSFFFVRRVRLTPMLLFSSRVTFFCSLSMWVKLERKVPQKKKRKRENLGTCFFSSSIFFSRSLEKETHKKRAGDDDDDDDGRCANTTPRRTWRREQRGVVVATRDGSSRYIWDARRVETEWERREVLLRRQ